MSASDCSSNGLRASSDGVQQTQFNRCPLARCPDDVTAYCEHVEYRQTRVIVRLCLLSAGETLTSEYMPHKVLGCNLIMIMFVN